MSERESESAIPRKVNHIPILSELSAPILSYLLAPYENGYWQLKASWNTSSKFSLYFLEKLGTLVEAEKEAEAEPFSPTAIVRKLPEDKRLELLRVTGRISPINLLFTAIVRNAAGEGLPRISDYDKWIGGVNLDEVRRDFGDALKIFEEGIYFDGFQAGVGTRLFRIKSGLISFLETPRKSGILHVVGTERADICKMRDFYSALGVLDAPTIDRVFAPDEALFRPYFSMVSGVLPYIIKDGQVSNIFTQALEYYEDEDYQHCISTLGLIAEDYLQRIYTSLLREPISGGLTLGQTLDRLHKRIDELFPLAKASQKTLDAAYDQIRALDSTASIESLAPILREFVALIRDDRSYYGRRLDELVRPQSRHTPFPGRINESLNELLKWRNAASHNSRVPLGAHEADRTLYCLVSVVNWWQEQLTTLDWSKSKLEVIDSLLQAAKPTTGK